MKFLTALNKLRTPKNQKFNEMSGQLALGKVFCWFTLSPKITVIYVILY